MLLLGLAGRLLRFTLLLLAPALLCHGVERPAEPTATWRSEVGVTTTGPPTAR